jgi:hypothetical protein
MSHQTVRNDRPKSNFDALRNYCHNPSITPLLMLNENNQTSSNRNLSKLNLIQESGRLNMVNTWNGFYEV